MNSMPERPVEGTMLHALTQVRSISGLLASEPWVVLISHMNDVLWRWSEDDNIVDSCTQLSHKITNYTTKRAGTVDQLVIGFAESFLMLMNHKVLGDITFPPPAPPAPPPPRSLEDELEGEAANIINQALSSAQEEKDAAEMKTNLKRRNAAAAAKNAIYQREKTKTLNEVLEELAKTDGPARKALGEPNDGFFTCRFCPQDLSPYFDPARPEFFGSHLRAYHGSVSGSYYKCMGCYKRVQNCRDPSCRGPVIIDSDDDRASCPLCPKSRPSSWSLSGLVTHITCIHSQYTGPIFKCVKCNHRCRNLSHRLTCMGAMVVEISGPLG